MREKTRTDMPARDQERRQQAVRLYEQYGRSLEAEHRGEYVAILPGGTTIVGPDLKEVIERARTTVGPGTFVFKVGDRAVGKWR